MDNLEFVDFLSGHYFDNYFWFVFTLPLVGLLCAHSAVRAISSVRDTAWYQRNWALLLTLVISLTLFIARLVLGFFLGGANLIFVFYLPFWCGFLLPAPFVFWNLLTRRPTYRRSRGQPRTDREIILSTLKNYAVAIPVAWLWFYTVRRLFPGLECGLLLSLVLWWQIPRLRFVFYRIPWARYALTAYTLIASYLWIAFTYIGTYQWLARLEKPKRESSFETQEVLCWLADEWALGLALIPLAIRLWQDERRRPNHRPMILTIAALAAMMAFVKWQSGSGMKPPLNAAKTSAHHAACVAAVLDSRNGSGRSVRSRSR